MRDMWRDIDAGTKALAIVSEVFVVVIVTMMVLAVVCVIQNGKNRIEEGVVLAKSFTPGGTHVQYGAGGEIQGIYSTPDKYAIKLRGEKDGKEVEYWMTCTEEEYESRRVGDYFKR